MNIPEEIELCLTQISRLRWALQIASALSFLHNKNLFFVSLNPSTVWLKDDLSATLVELSGMAYKWEQGYGGTAEAYDAPGRYSDSWPDDQETWVKFFQDIYAFGSLLYFIIKEEDSPHRLATPMEFPDVCGIACDDVIWRCWHKEYTTMAEVSADLRVVVQGQGLEMLGEDDIVLDPSVIQLKGRDIFDEVA